VIPLSDDNPTLRAPVVTIALLFLLGATWIVVQHAGLDGRVLGATVCEYGLVPGELSGMARVGTAVPIARDLLCVVDRDPINWLTPLT